MDRRAPFAELTARQNATRIAMQKRRKRAAHPLSGLAATATLAADASGIDMAAVFGARTDAMTVRVHVRRTGAATGTILDLGSSTRGALLVVGATDDVGIQVGASSAGDSVLVIAADALTVVGREYEVVAAWDPPTGKAAIWIGSSKAAEDLAINGSFNGAWSDTEAGAIGANSGTQMSLLAGFSGAPTNFSITRPVAFYGGQLPRRF